MGLTIVHHYPRVSCTCTGITGECPLHFLSFKVEDLSRPLQPAEAGNRVISCMHLGMHQLVVCIAIGVCFYFVVRQIPFQCPGPSSAPIDVEATLQVSIFLEDGSLMPYMPKETFQ